MKVLIVANNDYGNVGYGLDMALRSVGVDSICLKKVRHALKYPGTAKIYIKEDLRNYAEKADILQFMHSENTHLNIGNQFDGRKGIAVFHGGSTYRSSCGSHNRFWNGKAGVTLVQTGDLLGKGAKNEVWFLPPIDTEGLQPVYSKAGSKRIISHYPSTEVKGTNEFNMIMKKLTNEPELKNKFVYKFGRRTDWTPNIKRMKQCDIYFDACCPTLKGNPYGEWGISALEACCLGKVVVSHFISVNRYKKEFGIECPIQHANNMVEVKQQIRKLILMPDDEFRQLQEKTRTWVVENHSYKVVGKRLVDIYNKHLTWKGKK